MTVATGSAFTRHTAVTRQLGDGSVPGEPAAGDRIIYDAMIDESWWIIMGPNGGYIAAIFARAAIDAAGSVERRLHSLTLHYLRPPTGGPCRVEVAVERVGRGVSAVTVRMTQADKAIAVGVASIAVPRDSISFDASTMPAVPSPENTPIPVTPDGAPPLAMLQHFRNRPVFGHLMGTIDPPGVPRSGGWMIFAEDTPIDEVALVALCDAWWPPIMEMGLPPMAVPTVDLTVHVRAVPAEPFVAVLGEFLSPLAADGYLIEDGTLWSPDGVLLAQSRQLAVLM